MNTQQIELHSWSLTSEQRVGRADRERTLEYLRVMFQDEYLTSEEWHEKMAATFQAKTWGDIAHIIQHLPSMPQAQPKSRKILRYRLRLAFHLAFSIAVILAWVPFRIFTSTFAVPPGGGWTPLGIVLMFVSILGGLLSLLWAAYWHDHNEDEDEDEDD